MRWVPAFALLAAAVAWWAIAKTYGPPLLLVVGAIIAQPARYIGPLKLIRDEQDVAPLAPPPLMAYLFTPIVVALGLLVDHARLAPVFALIASGLGIAGFVVGIPAWRAFGRLRTRGTVANVVGAIDGHAIVLDETDRFRASGFGNTRTATSSESYTVRGATSFAVGATVLIPAQLAWWTSRVTDDRRWLAAGDEVAFDGTTLLAAPPGEDPLAQVHAVINYWRGVAIGCAVVAAAAIAILVR